MYQYDQYDQKMVDTRVEEFRDQVKRRLAGDLTEDQFKPLRLMNGLYLQLHAYMLRVTVPYGTLSSKQMRMLGHIARKYDRDYGHFTTRQNIQYNWIKLEDAPDILADLASVEMHAIQTSGNCIRNISSDQFAGATADEIADPRPWAELLRQWSSFHPEFSYLPRKFKFAVIASDTDRAAMRLHDIGIQLVHNDAGELGAKFFVGGGMGQVEEEFAHMKQLGLNPPVEELARITQYFQDPPFDKQASVDIDLSDPDFALWVDQNISAHKQPGYAIATISLKPRGGIPGDASSAQIDLMADLAEQYSFDELRVTHSQNIVLPYVKKSDLYALWQKLDDAGLAPANLDLITDSIACPGLDYCSLANARSIPLAQKISERFADLGRQRELGELKLKISGCINACGHHHAGHIGILGVDRKGTENYQLLLGGSGAEDASLAKITGPGFTEDGVIDAIETVTDLYLEQREEGERFIDTYRRVGMARFKEAIYG